MLTSSVEEGSTPSPRYHHASALLSSHDSGSGSHGASHNFMLVVGGVTQNGVAMDTWSLNLSSLVWREHKVNIGYIENAKISAKCEVILPNKILFLLTLTEHSAAPIGRSYFNGTSRLLCSADRRLLPREWLQPPSAGVQPSY